MGLATGHDLLSALVAQISSLELIPPGPINVYVDGLLYLFCGVLKHVTTANEVAQIAYQTIVSHAEQVRLVRTLQLQSVTIVLDGIRPRIKAITSQNRKLRRTTALGVDILECKLRLVDLLKRLQPKYIIQQLDQGEAEMECFVQRNTGCASLILTDDSDMLHIAYKYPQVTPNDRVYVARKHYTTIYDFATSPKYPLCRRAFKVLAFALGSDFTVRLFTKSMMRAVISATQSSPELASAMNVACELEDEASEMQRIFVIERLLCASIVLCANEPRGAI